MSLIRQKDLIARAARLDNMKKVFILFALILIFSPIAAHGETSPVTNNISGGITQQYYIFNCSGTDCEQIIEKFMQLQNIDNNPDPIITPMINLLDQSTADTVQPTESVSTVTSAIPEIVVEEEELVQKIYAPRSVRISEIVAIPDSGENEWVELFNATNEAIDLTDWQLIEGGGKKTALAGTISPGEYLVFDKSYLNNDGDQLILKDKLNNVIDSVNYGDWEQSVAPAGKQGNSIILSGEQYSETTKITKGSANILSAPVVIEEKSSISATEPAVSSMIVQPQLPVVAITEEKNGSISSVINPIDDHAETENNNSDTPPERHVSKVFINEFLPNPKDGEEWVELFNAGETDEDLFGYTLDDSPTGSSPYEIKTHIILPAKGFLLLKAGETKIALNNDRDQLSLRDGTGNLLSFAEYEQTKSGLGYSLFADGWRETAVLTPGAENIKQSIQAAVVTQKVSTTKKDTESSLGSDYQEISVEEAKNISLKTKIKLRGQVVVLPKVFNEKYMYLNGLQVYFSQADWPVFDLGDELEIRGTISESGGERRLVVKEKTDISLFETQNPLVPTEIGSLDLTDDNAGSLVRLVGTLVEKKGSKMIFADDNGEFAVQFNPKTAIKASDYDVGNALQVSGILKKYNDEYRIMPRGKDDLVFSAESPAAMGSSVHIPENYFAKKVFAGLISLAALLFFINLYFFWQKKDELKKILVPIKQILWRIAGKPC